MDNIQYFVLKETRLLKPIAVGFAQARTEMLDLRELFANRHHRYFNRRKYGCGLRVNTPFKERLGLDEPKIVEPTPQRHYVAYVLKERAHDHEIIRELPEKYLSFPEDIARFVESWEMKSVVSEEGWCHLLIRNDDYRYANLFYLKDKDGECFTAVTRWEPQDYVDYDASGWEIYGNSDREKQWEPDTTRIICPVT